MMKPLLALDTTSRGQETAKKRRSRDGSEFLLGHEPRIKKQGVVHYSLLVAFKAKKLRTDAFNLDPAT